MSVSLISKLTGVPERRVKGDFAEIFPEEFEGVSKNATKEEKFEAFINYTPTRAKGRTRGKRITNRILKGCAVKPPADLECHKWGDMVIKTANHISMMYCVELMNDMEYLYHAAEITPNPTECSDFFYQFVNEYLNANKAFRLMFLRKLFLNDLLLTKTDILSFVQTYGFETEYQSLIKDETLKQEIKEKFKDTTSVADYVRFDGISWGTTKRKYPNYKLASDANLRLNNLLSCFEGSKVIKIGEQGRVID